MKFGVVTFPGSNCDQDMIDALHAMGQQVIRLWHKDTDLSAFSTDDMIILPGGFSYGDYLRCGALARFSPIMSSIIAFARQGGKVLGVCNGFQILCEAHLLPGVLLPNAGRNFICRNTYIISRQPHTLLTRKAAHRPLLVPIAHAEGRYYADEDTIENLFANGQVIFQYCNEHGEVSATSNPNGSLHHIAGICNREKNVFGMMPHPERAVLAELGNTDGRPIFESILSYSSSHQLHSAVS
ncbi:phosphoribosylformylglycinamidine synthase subunit PurQ [Thermoflavifilum thermophilum]|uniref:Phosphoribosylformylglycinamidine synthase subunit PurQ n=1 Tax=Thermoflavifilum thermophilum TaxID=1393122 RepID=A0A1I7N4U6_9BACT|nr:phosphoribosylformylglycinamidine synthase subunit PurQ [Thermoflavifilum thermophilum]SFV29603.1 phosphoribosylformylglycinamidine synthase [Thermoflavifilum thermophilum]